MACNYAYANGGRGPITANCNSGDGGGGGGPALGEDAD